MLIRRRAYSMRASRAFTLVELLVAIGVIAILAALVLSAFSRTRVTAQAITCRNNLRQWGHGNPSLCRRSRMISCRRKVKGLQLKPN